jgi:hypothetical protein
MADKQWFDWKKGKQKILKIVKSDSAEETKKLQIESLLKTLPFGIGLTNYKFSYNACGYPCWATHKNKPSDSFMLREILDQEMDPETFETDFRCPCCGQFASHKT